MFFKELIFWKIRVIISWTQVHLSLWLQRKSFCCSLRNKSTIATGEEVGEWVDVKSEVQRQRVRESRQNGDVVMWWCMEASKTREIINGSLMDLMWFLFYVATKNLCSMLFREILVPKVIFKVIMGHYSIPEVWLFYFWKIPTSQVQRKF